MLNQIAEIMKEDIYQELKKLRRLRLTRSTRASQVECLKFGFNEVIDKGGELTNIGLFGIHLSCDWRFVDSNKILVGSQDLFEPLKGNRFTNTGFDWEEPNANIRDVTIQELINFNHLVVVDVDADDYGGFVVTFGNDVRLEVFPSLSKADKHAEYWRFLDNQKKKHFVVGGFGNIWI